MSAIVLKAHFDGKNILLDEPFEFPSNASVRVIVTQRSDSVQDERADWLALSAEGLARAYGDDEPEYTLADIKP